jgi:hypothetical protein
VNVELQHPLFQEASAAQFAAMHVLKQQALQRMQSLPTAGQPK